MTTASCSSVKCKHTELFVIDMRFHVCHVGKTDLKCRDVRMSELSLHEIRSKNKQISKQTNKQTNKRWVFSNSFCGMHFYQTFRIKHKEQHRLTKKAEFQTPFQKQYPINDVSFSAAHFGFWLCIVPSNYIFGLKLCHAKRQKIRTHRQPLANSTY